MSETSVFSAFSTNKGCPLFIFDTSNYLQDVHFSSSRSFVTRLQFLNLLFYLVIKLLQEFCFAFRAATVIDAQTFFFQVDARRHILTSKRFRHLESLFQDFYTTGNINPTDVMNSPFCQRQSLWQGFTFFFPKLSTSLFTACFPYAFATQGGWSVIQIPPQKLHTLSSHIFRRTKIVSVPKTSCPQSVDPLNLGVSLWLTRWNEDEFDSKIERDSHKNRARLAQIARKYAQSCQVL